MSAPSYRLDPDAAKSTDNGASRITETGAYTGIFTAAKHIVAKSGAVGIEFSFQSASRQEANYLAIYTHNSNGDQIFGFNQISALMTCLKLREIVPSQGTIDVYDPNARGVVKQQATIYQQLMMKNIGVVLQSEEYPKNNVEVGKRMVLVRFFDAKTRQTASEILDGSPAAKLDSYLVTLKDKTLASGSSPRTATNSTAATGGYDDFDDDIPF